MEHLIYGLALIVFGFLFGLEYGEEISIRAKILKEVGIIAEGFKTFYLGAGQISIPKPIHPDSVPELETCCDFEGFVKANEKFFNKEEYQLLSDDEVARIIPELLQLKMVNSPWDELLEGVADTESLADYQGGCNCNNLTLYEKFAKPVYGKVVEPEDFCPAYSEFLLVEDEETWQKGMRDDLKFYCPQVVVGRIIARIEEIVDQQK